MDFDITHDGTSLYAISCPGIREASNVRTRKPVSVGQCDGCDNVTEVLEDDSGTARYRSNHWVCDDCNGRRFDAYNERVYG